MVQQSLQSLCILPYASLPLESTQRTLFVHEFQKLFIQSIKKKELLDQEKQGEVYRKFKNIFSDGELLEVKKED